MTQKTHRAPRHVHRKHNNLSKKIANQTLKGKGKGKETQRNKTDHCANWLNSLGDHAFEQWNNTDKIRDKIISSWKSKQTTMKLYMIYVT